MRRNTRPTNLLSRILQALFKLISQPIAIYLLMFMILALLLFIPMTCHVVSVIPTIQSVGSN